MFPAFSTPLTDVQRTILAMSLTVPSLRRNDICDSLSLSPQTVMRALQPLRTFGAITEHPMRVGGKGQPAREISFQPGRLGVIGLGISENLVSVVLQDLGGEVLARHTFNGMIGRRAPALNQLEALLIKLRAELPDAMECIGCGIAAQGFIVEPGHRIAARGELAEWAKVDLKAWGESITGLPTTLENDSTAIAIQLNAQRQDMPDDSFVFMLSTGIGGGIIAGGQPITGWKGNAGEIGKLVPDGPHRPTDTNMRKAFGLEDWADLPKLSAADRDRGLAWLQQAAIELKPAVEAIIAILNVEAIFFASPAPIEIIETLVAAIPLELPGESLIASGMPAEILRAPSLEPTVFAGLEDAGCALARRKFLQNSG